MKVLVADDEIVSRRLIESSVQRWGYDVITARDGLEAAAILQSPDAPKLAILDWLMPGLDGLQLCRNLRRKGDEGYVYIVLLTAKHAKDDVIEGLEAGADDYITKPFDPHELRVRLRTGKRILYLLDQLIMAREALREQAARDSLTGLWNHNTVIDLLSKEIGRAERRKTHLGVVLLDLDHFKAINDTHGHLKGDHVLRKTAEALQGAIRPYDAVGRFGGEEFLVVLPGCDRMNATSHAERLRHVMSQLTFEMSAGVNVTASFGVTVVEPDAPVDADSAIAAADSALYAAKDAGRNCVEFRDSRRMMEPVAASGGLAAAFSER